MIDEQTLARYRALYGLDDSIGEGHVALHWELEQRLTRDLLGSTPADRWEIFERCYTQLYEDLPWLQGTGAPVDPIRWTKAIGQPPRSVYEVGSGAGALARALASVGYEVVATDASRERGGTRSDDRRLRWDITDGVNLAQFAPESSFDAVISDQLIEHLHPDDLSAHFSGARALLKPTGRYVFRTPHSVTGPHDVSAVFLLSQPAGMHLKEYSNAELVSAALGGGFRRVRSLATVSGVPSLTRVSDSHLRFQLRLEASRWARSPRGRAALRRAKAPIRPDVWLIAEA